MEAGRRLAGVPVSQASRYILVLVSGALVWGSARPALAQPVAPPPPLPADVARPLPMATPPLAALGGQPSMPIMPSPTAEWTGPVVEARPYLDEPYQPFCFPKGVGTFEFNFGGYGKTAMGPPVPSYQWLPFNFRLGHIYDWPHVEGLLRGCFEPMVEFTASPVLNSFGKYMVGTTAFLRYNFVQPDCRVVPYYQLGIGFTYNDGYHDQEQRALGQAIEFYLQTQIGVKWFIRNNLSVNLEGGFIHISNCNTATRNLGINALGGSVGLTYYFPLCWKQ
jgi:lipid A 3-O-deacylase